MSTKCTNTVYRRKRIAVISNTTAPYPTVVSALQAAGTTAVVKAIPIISDADPHTHSGDQHAYGHPDGDTHPHRHVDTDSEPDPAWTVPSGCRRRWSRRTEGLGLGGPRAIQRTGHTALEPERGPEPQRHRRPRRSLDRGRFTGRSALLVSIWAGAPAPAPMDPRSRTRPSRRRTR